MRKFVIMVFFMISLACQRLTPLDFKPGEFPCEHCRMSIVQMAFKAEAITHKGKIYRFDSIECLLTWAKSHEKDIGSLWVTDYYHPSQWLRLEQAHFLKSRNLASPMGGSLSAYASEQDLQLAAKQFGGNPITLEKLKAADFSEQGLKERGLSP